MLFGDVRVALGRNDRRVTKELLDQPEIRTVSEKKSGHGVAEHVGGDVATKTGGGGEVGESVRYALSGEAAAQSIQEEGIG